MPTFVQLRVTNLCNLRCKMCGQWGDSGIYRDDGFPDSATDGEKERNRHPRADRRQTPARARPTTCGSWTSSPRPSRSSASSEESPSSTRTSSRLVREIKSRGLTCTVITNGGRLERYAKELVEAGIDSIAVSIDGPPSVHDRIRGQKGASRRRPRASRAVAKWRARAEARSAHAARDPAGDGAEHRRHRAGPGGPAGASARHGQHRAAVVHPRRGRRRVREGHAGDLRRDGRLPGRASSSPGPAGRRAQDAADDRPRQAPEEPAPAALTRFRARPALGLLRPDVPAEKVPEYFTDFSPDVRPRPLPGRLVLRAGRAGRRGLASAATSPTTSSATCAKQPFREIWTGPKAWRFREKLAKEPLPICARCCGNYVYGK